MRSLTVTVFAGVAIVAATAAAEPYHIRGTLTAVDGGTLTIAADTGDTVSVALNDDALIFTVAAARAADISRGKFVGITSVESGAERVAIEVHIFEEALRGLAAGHYPWDLVEQDNMMTNATIAKLVDAGDGRELTVTYVAGDATERTVGTTTIIVPPEATIVSFTATDRGALVPGETVFIIAVDTDDGVISPAMVIGQNGIDPPM